MASCLSGCLPTGPLALSCNHRHHHHQALGLPGRRVASLPVVPLMRRQPGLLGRRGECARRRPVPPARMLPFFQQSSERKRQQDAQGLPPTFELPLAIALAGSAFEAYLEPTGAEGFQQRSLNGSEITFTDGEFLSEMCEAILRVDLVGALGLRNADVIGLSDPYAVISVGPCAVRSSVVNNNLDPQWNQTFLLYVRSIEKDVLKVRLYDEDKMKSDDDLGTAMAAIAALKPGAKQELSLDLKGPGGQGKVHLAATLTRFSDHLLDVVTSDDIVVPGEGEASLAAAPSQATQLAEAAAAVELATTAPAGGPAGKEEGQYYQNLLGQLDAIKEQLASGVDRLRRGAGEDAGGAASSSGKGEEVNLDSNPWKVLAKQAGRTSSSNWTPVGFVNNDEFDSQAWVYRNVEAREAVISFRGTEQVKWKDLLTDLNLVPAELTPERYQAENELVRLVKAVTPNKKMMVHSGFLAAYDAIRPQVWMLLDAITCSKDDTGGEPWRVYITGHSLGGALATLCAYELATRQGPARARQVISLYTFGAPRAGNKVFAQAYDAAVPDSWRICNTNDVIPTVPRLLGYAHVRHSVRLLEGGRLEIQGNAGTDVFGEGKGGLDVLQELQEKAQAQGGKWDEVYSEVAAREMEILETLTNGKALEEHMETYYLQTLQECVLASLSTSAAAAAGVLAQHPKEKST